MASLKWIRVLRIQEWNPWGSEGHNEVWEMGQPQRACKTDPPCPQVPPTAPPAPTSPPRLGGPGRVAWCRSRSAGSPQAASRKEWRVAQRTSVAPKTRALVVFEVVVESVASLGSVEFLSLAPAHPSDGRSRTMTFRRGTGRMREIARKIAKFETC